MAKKSVFSIASIILVLFSLAGCAESYLYDESWILGKTSAEVIARYGEFDKSYTEPSEDGLYRGNACFYFLSPKRERFLLEDIQEKWYTITFDGNGVAIRCRVREGGWA